MQISDKKGANNHGIGVHNENIRLRLQQLLEAHAASDIARKTGTQRSNVSRYMKGTKIPAEFCAALIDGLGVNPAWLLTGEGTQYLDDMASDTASTTGDLMELTQSMNAVMRMRLGSLSDKDHLKAVRSFSEHLASFNTLRTKLNERVRPLFKDVVEDFSRALSAGKYESARKFRDAALQLAPLCDDPDLLLHFDHWQAILANVTGNWVGFLELERRVFLQRAASGAVLDSEALDAANGLIVALTSTCRVKEARRVSEAALALARDREPTPNYHFLQFGAGVAELLLGEPDQGLARMQKHFKKFDREARVLFRPKLFQAMLLSGTVGEAEVMGLYSDKLKSIRTGAALAAAQTRTSVIIAYLCMIEDWPLLKKNWKRISADAAYTAPLIRAYVEAVMSAIESGNQEIARKFSVECKDYAATQLSPELIALVRRIFTTQIARVEGDREFALAQLEQAESLLPTITEEFTIPIFHLATHYRNALDLIEEDTRSTSRKELRKRAQGYFDDHYASGYGCFERYASDPE